jgi:hypothetical protein
MQNKLDFWNFTGIVLALFFTSSALMAMTFMVIRNYFLETKTKIPDP